MSLSGIDTSASSTLPVGRFAPSPTGHMHAGNIFSALIAWLVVKKQGGRMVCRIEDLDRQRSKPEFADRIMRDLARLGLTWDHGPYYQSDRDAAYEAAFRVLDASGSVYPCFCTRADLHSASAPHEAEKSVYRGTCRHLNSNEAQRRIAGRPPAYRLAVPEEHIGFEDGIQGRFLRNIAEECGDFIIKRSDGMFAYQLAVVVDDIEHGITSVVRGCDLMPATLQQLYLFELLDAEAPEYCHIPLLVDHQGRRLSKRDHDAGFDALIERFVTPEGVIGHIAHLAGLIPEDEPCRPENLIAGFSLDALRSRKTIVWD